ncbi:DUF4917 family protein [Kribbella sp. NBC_01505]|uniref:DUF4917 family protein n=1 Tax=Kribbella sp. NBC_01505 TaxID=2903580 RepID=UPI00386450AE
MHLYVSNRKVHKLKLSNGPLLMQLRSNLLADLYPLVVTEGSRSDKEARIARSAYLTYCLDRLRRLSGTLFIHGMALSSNDGHILEALSGKVSRVGTVYVGLFGGPSRTRDEVEIQAKALVHARKKNGGRPLRVRFYASESAKAWG